MSSFLVMTPAEIARLIDAHAAPLVLYARQWCTEPEDVVQDAFLKLVRQSRPPKTRSRGFTAWFATGPSMQPRSPGGGTTRDGAARPASWFIEPEVDGLDAATAVDALERLSLEQREVIVARHWGGLSFEQIATVVGCSASTAFRRYTAGVEQLRKHWG